jgi:hypothetical protein
MQEKPGEIYRKHQTQSTAAPGYRDEAEKAARIGLVLRRADTIRQFGWKWQSREPVTI